LTEFLSKLRGAAWASCKAVPGDPEVTPKIWNRTYCILILEESIPKKVKLTHQIYHAPAGANGAVQELHCRPKRTLDIGGIDEIERDQAGSQTVSYAK